jgi:hypothetical protein
MDLEGLSLGGGGKFQLNQPTAGAEREFTAKAKKKTESKGMRAGRWTKEEEAYANRLIEEFSAGLLPMHDGRMLRMFLAKALNCDPMRISKKFVGNSAIGKQVYKRQQDKIDRLSEHELNAKITEILQLEQKFLNANKEQSVRQHSRKTANFPSAVAAMPAQQQPPYQHHQHQQNQQHQNQQHQQNQQNQQHQQHQHQAPPSSRISHGAVRRGSFGLQHSAGAAVPSPGGLDSFDLAIDMNNGGQQQGSPQKARGRGGSVESMFNLLDEIRPRSFSTTSMENFLASGEAGESF